MPILSGQAESQDAPVGKFPKEPEAPEAPSGLDIAAAAERTANLAGQVYAGFTNDTLFPAGKDDPSFDPVDHIPQGYLHDYGSKFMNARNPEQIAQVKRQIDAERTDQGIIARGGNWGTVATLAAGLTDPVSIASMALFPEAAPTRLGNMLRWGLTNAAVTGGQELLSQELQATRSTKESLFNVGAGAVLGGLLGGIARRVPEALQNELRENLHTELTEGGTKVLGPQQHSILEQPLPSDIPEVKGEEVKPGKPDEPIAGPPLSDEPLGSGTEFISPTGESTAGAAQVKTPELDEEGLGLGAKTLAGKLMSRYFPSLRVLESPSKVARQLVQQLANIPEVLSKNLKGLSTAQPVERELWKQQGAWYQGWAARRDAFQSYLERMKKEGEDPISRVDFKEEIAGAMRRGDEHEIPEVAQAAKDTRAAVIEPLYQRALKLGLLPKDANLYAKSYLLRQYNIPYIKANYAKWIDTLTKGFEGQGVEHAEAMDIAHQVDNKISRGERATMDWRVMEGITPKSGRLKGRELPLPDTVLEPFLNNDIDHLTQSYIHSLAPEVEMTEKFGSRDMKDQFGELNDEYARLKEQAIAKGDDKQIAMLNEHHANDIRDLAAMRDRLYGIQGMPKDPSAFFVRAGRFMRSLNVPLSLGSATLSHFPDVANAIMRYGTPQTFAAIGKMLGDSNLRNIALKEAQRLGVAVDMVMNVTASMLGDYGSHSQFAEQRFMAGVAKAFTIGTGETPLITAMQSVTSALANHEVLSMADKVAAGTKVPAYRMAKLASAGLDEDMLRRIASQKAYGTEVSGLRFGQSDTWADKGAAKAFESAVIKDAHAVTLRPGVGDTPLLMSTELGKLVMQFQTFGFAANRIVLNPLAQGLAAGDANAIQGLFALMFMGSMAYGAKQMVAGQPIEWGNPKHMASEVMDKSNLLGWMGHYLAPALYQMGQTEAAGWGVSDAVQAFGGPSLGRLAELYQHKPVAKALAGEGEKGFNRSDLHFATKMVPGSRTWYLRRGVDRLEDAVGDAFDLPGLSNQDRAEKAQQENQ